jgi:dUTP pyrophosphatase
MYDKGVNVLNGIIDEPYRGIPHVAAHKIGILPRRIKAGSRIAQMVIVPYIECHLIESVIKNDTMRGEKGFGHTNVGG